ncbi:MAG: FIST C-terminal domain-containing protein [Elusimicrobiota bacterium]|jgi:hypothetical protein|nr:FIST C-terminal domain-containing protein [Elusimicrobiota bacterium]
MIKMFNAGSSKIDEPEAAAAELLEQIKSHGGLLKNSVGIIACYYEFAETNILDILHKNLQFDIIGTTVMGSAVNSQYGIEQISLCVLTSDDISFSTSFSEIITKDNTEQVVKQAYAQARVKLDGEPSLIFALAPISAEVMGDVILEHLDAACGGAPIFGTLSNETSPTYEKACVFLNGDKHQNKVAMILMRGEINPRFYSTAISDKNIQKQAAVVTDSDGYFLRTINNVPLKEYLISIGVQTYGLASTTTLPFLVDYGDGAKPVALSMYSITSKGGYLGGKVPVGAKILFAEANYDSVLETAETTLKKVLEDIKKNGANGIFAIPCFTRLLLLSPNSENEMIKTKELIGNAAPFMLCYSGGEICPVYSATKRLLNRFHNLTYTVMVF